MAAHMKKTEWDNIPEWAIYALEYGTEEDGSLNKEERAMIEKFIGTHFPKGYRMNVDWDACNEFDRYPAFGEPCRTGTPATSLTAIPHLESLARPARFFLFHHKYTER